MPVCKDNTLMGSMEKGQGRVRNVSFSVVIPLFNKAEFIERAVDSVLSQTVGPAEIIVVDDGSDDSGGQRVSQYSDERIVLLEQENKGVGAARNAGVDHASGTWIALLDADDAWLPNHLEELAELAFRFPDCGLLSTRYMEFKSGCFSKTDVAPVVQIFRRKVDYFMEASFDPGFICSSAVSVKRNVFERLGGFGSDKIGEDSEFWARVALDFPVASSNLVTSIYYRGTGGVIEGLHNNAVPTAPVESLSDVAPAIKMLCQRAEADPRIMQSRSVREYINGRLLLSIRSNILNGHISRARSFSLLMLKPVKMRFLIWKLFVLLPKPLIKIAVWTNQRVKKSP